MAPVVQGDVLIESWGETAPNRSRSVRNFPKNFRPLVVIGCIFVTCHEEVTIPTCFTNTKVTQKGFQKHVFFWTPKKLKNCFMEAENWLPNLLPTAQIRH